MNLHQFMGAGRWIIYCTPHINKNEKKTTTQKQQFASLQNLYMYKCTKKAFTLSYCDTNSERSGKRRYSHPTFNCQPDTDLFLFYIFYFFILHLEMNIAMFFKTRQWELLKLVFVCVCVRHCRSYREIKLLYLETYMKNATVTPTSRVNNVKFTHAVFRTLHMFSDVVQYLFLNMVLRWLNLLWLLMFYFIFTY